MMDYALTNGRERIQFGEDFVLLSVSEGPTEIKGEENGILDGFGYNSLGARFGGKALTLSGYIVGSDIANKKRLLNRITTPSVDYFYLEKGTTQLKCRLHRGIEYGEKKHSREKTLSFKITLFAPYPVWEEKTEIKNTYYSLSSASGEDGPIIIQNEGDVRTGFLLRMVFLVDADYIELMLEDKLITIKGAFTTGDSFYIDTRRGQERAYVVFKNTTTEINGMKYITLDSELFKLEPGENSIGYELYGGAAHMEITYKQGYLL